MNPARQFKPKVQYGIAQSGLLFALIGGLLFLSLLAGTLAGGQVFIAALLGSAAFLGAFLVGSGSRRRRSCEAGGNSRSSLGSRRPRCRRPLEAPELVVDFERFFALPTELLQGTYDRIGGVIRSRTAATAPSGTGPAASGTASWWQSAPPLPTAPSVSGSRSVGVRGTSYSIAPLA